MKPIARFDILVQTPLATEQAMRTKFGLILIFALSLVVAACGGGDSDTTTTTAAVAADTTTTTQTATAATTTTAVVVATTEAQARTLTLSAGEELVLVAGFPPGVTEKAGFGVEGEDITSPGPTIRVRKGETVTITFENAHYRETGSPFPEPHNFTIVADKDVPRLEMEPLWGAHVGGFDDDHPLAEVYGTGLKAGERGSVTFTAETAGSFYYVCAIGSHIANGMWGRFIVEE